MCSTLCGYLRHCHSHDDCWRIFSDRDGRNTGGDDLYVVCQISTFDNDAGGDEDVNKLLWSLDQFRS
ncbi:MAG: hypothetical protein ACI85V_001164 [bacterium]|jgi:hypothetical protein